MPRALLAHDRDCSFGHDDDTKQICFDLRSDVFQACVLNRTDVAVTGVVYQHIKPATRVDRGPNRICSGPRTGYVKSDRSDFVAIAFDQII